MVLGLISLFGSKKEQRPIDKYWDFCFKVIQFSADCNHEKFVNIPSKHFEDVLSELLKESLEHERDFYLTNKLNFASYCVEFRKVKEKQTRTKQKLAENLELIEKNDTNYDVRYGLVFKAMWNSLKLGLNAGIRIDPSDTKWPICTIELPTGQTGWHMPAHSVPYDGHTTEEKYERCRQYTTSVKANQNQV